MIDAANVAHRLREAGVEIAIYDEKRISQITSDPKQRVERAKAAYGNWVDYCQVMESMTEDPFTKVRYPVQTMVEIDYFDSKALDSFGRRRNAAIDHSFVFTVGTPPGEVAQYIKPGNPDQNYLLVYPGRTQTEYGVSSQLPQQVAPGGPVPYQSSEHSVYVTIVTPEEAIKEQYDLKKGDFSGDVMVQKSEYGQAAVSKVEPIWRNVYNALINWVAGPCIDYLRLRTSYPLGFVNGNYVVVMEWYASEVLAIPDDGLLLTRPSDAEEFDYDDIFRNRNYLKTYDILTIWNRSQRYNPETGETEYTPVTVEDEGQVSINFRNSEDASDFEDSLRGPNLEARIKEIDTIFVQYSENANRWHNMWEEDHEYIRFRVEEALNWSRAYKYAGNDQFIEIEFGAPEEDGTVTWVSDWTLNSVLIRIRELSTDATSSNPWFTRRLPDSGNPTRFVDNLDLTNLDGESDDTFVFPSAIPNILNLEADPDNSRITWDYPETGAGDIDGIAFTISNLGDNTTRTFTFEPQVIDPVVDPDARTVQYTFDNTYEPGMYQVFARAYMTKGHYNLLAENSLTVMITLR